MEGISCTSSQIKVPNKGEVCVYVSVTQEEFNAQ